MKKIHISKYSLKKCPSIKAAAKYPSHSISSKIIQYPVNSGLNRINSGPHRKITCPCDGGCPRCLVKGGKHKINSSNDIYDQETDYAGERVNKRTDVSSHFAAGIYREAKDKGYKKDAIQDKNAPFYKLCGKPYLESMLNLSGNNGETLPKFEQEFFEHCFGMNLNNVRVHTDAQSAKAADIINSRAFVFRNHIFFNRSEFSPGTHTGKRLLAHELTHVISQTKNDEVLSNQKGYSRGASIFDMKIQRQKSRRKGSKKYPGTIEDLNNKIIEMGLKEFAEYLRKNAHLEDLKRIKKNNPSIPVDSFYPILLSTFEAWAIKNEYGDEHVKSEVKLSAFKKYIKLWLIDYGYLFNFKTLEVTKVKKPEDFKKSISQMPDKEIAHYIVSGLMIGFGKKQWEDIKRNPHGIKINKYERMCIIEEVLEKRYKEKSEKWEGIDAFLEEHYPGKPVIIRNEYDMTFKEDKELSNAYLEKWTERGILNPPYESQPLQKKYNLLDPEVRSNVIDKIYSKVAQKVSESRNERHLPSIEIASDQIKLHFDKLATFKPSTSLGFELLLFIYAWKKMERWKNERIDELKKRKKEE